jgi:hypothetical protein
VIRGNLSRTRRYYNPAYVNAPIKGHPPVYYAVINGHDSVVKFLLANGAKKSYRAAGRSLAYHAARSGDRPLGVYLASVGAGTSADVSNGTAQYAANQRGIREQNEAIAAAALTVIGAMFSGDGGSSADEDYQNRLNSKIMEDSWNASKANAGS